MIIGASFGQKLLFTEISDGQATRFVVVSHGESTDKISNVWKLSPFPKEDQDSNFLENFDKKQLVALLPESFFHQRFPLVFTGLHLNHLSKSFTLVLRLLRV